MEVKISIIMPVYNVEKYVGKTIQCMLDQTFKDFEFLIVDDGTKDNSGVICDEYAKKDPRITVIHKENGGAPSARNVAIDMAKGKYMYFVDSDDWAEPTMLEDMYNLAEKYQSQYVITGFYIDTYFPDGSCNTQEIHLDDKVYSSKEEFRADICRLMDKNLVYTPWNKLFLSSYILENNLRFDKVLWDDFPFNVKYFRDVERVVMSSKMYYHFIRARSDSETSKYNKNMFEKRLWEHNLLKELFTYWNMMDNDEVVEFLSRRHIERIIGCIENVYNKNSTKTAKEKRQEIKAILDEPNTAECARLAKPRSGKVKILLIPIKMKNVTVSSWVGKFISYVKRSNPQKFTHLKNTR